MKTKTTFQHHKSKHIGIYSLVIVILLAVCTTVPVVFAAVNFTVWDFEGETIIPSTDMTANAVATSGSGLGSQSFPAGNGSTDSWSFNSWSQGALDPNDYFGFKVDLSSYGHITLSFDERRSSTGIHNFEIHYSIDGTNFTQIASTVTNVPDNESWRPHTFDFGFETPVDLAIRGQSTVYFRIYGYNAEGTTGTWRIDNVTFSAQTNATALSLTDFNVIGKSHNALYTFIIFAISVTSIMTLRMRRKRQRI